MASNERADQLRRRVDDLAMRLVMEEAPGAPEGLRALSSALEKTGEEARQAGYPEAASIASSLTGRVSAAAGTGSADLAALARMLKEGIANLQRAVADRPPAPVPDGHAPPPQAKNLLIQDMDLLNDVIQESREHLSTVEAQLLRLERDPADSEAIHSTFRSFHTIKGLAGFLELTAIQEFAHEVETVLDSARNGKLAITPAVIDVVLASKDYLGRALDLIEPALNGGTAEEPPPAGALLERLRAVLGTPPIAVPKNVPSQPVRAAPLVPAAPKSEPAAPIREAAQLPQPPAARPAPEAAEVSEERTEDAARGSRPQSEARAVKVDTAKLDYLVDMAGEMMIAESQVRGDPDLLSLKCTRLEGNLAQLAWRCSELQKTAMSMRMVPVGQIFRRLPRLVRDLARKAGKKVELDLIGEETELDRTIIEELWDPLIHMVRNSIDHGIEMPEARQAAGKDPVGRIRLKACHQAGHILIEASDDGRGIAVEKVLAKAREKGLISENAHLAESDILNLIFEPGFSTAEKVTEISGRGVGMDVVRKHIQKLRGRIDVHSTPGQGSTFFLKLPLTLAIIDGLVIGVGRERYVVPLFAVREMFRPTSGMVFTVAGQGEVALVRGSMLPVLRLYRRFNVQPRSENPAESVFIIAENAGHVFCLMVDEFTGKQQVVIKSLGDTMKHLPGIAGGTILGDGRVALVLDLDGVFERRHD
ncbi:MAG: chemotaxis protein CheA [Bryobacteraceae bacterium]